MVEGNVEEPWRLTPSEHELAMTKKRIAKYGKPLPRLLGNEGLGEGCVRMLAQPGDGAKKVLETRSHLNRCRLMSSEKLGHVLAVECGTMRTQTPASTRARISEGKFRGRYAR